MSGIFFVFYVTVLHGGAELTEETDSQGLLLMKNQWGRFCNLPLKYSAKHIEKKTNCDIM